ncbi:MAG: TMEM175 family protein [Gemmataceae bacterium]|nr:TMEM175 family protein [Gemmataceae bacterium]
MSKGRLEAFSDGVLAIILTIMVLELKAPASADPEALLPVLPFFLSYLLSFAFIGIYWNNHHHLFQAARRVDGAVLWANLHLLFWLSLVPFTTHWMGQSGFAPWPVALYGVVLLLAAVAFALLVRCLVALEGKDSALAQAIGRDRKGNASLLLYGLSAPAAFLHPWLACAGYAAVALIWIVPDRRIEERIAPPAP